MFTAFARSPAARWFAVPLLAALGYGVYEYEHPHESSAAPAETRPIKAAKATVTFKVQSATQFDSGFTILNDREDYTEDGTQTVVCTKDALPKGFEDGKSLIGKQIVAEGRKASYKGRPQIRAQKVTVK